MRNIKVNFNVGPVDSSESLIGSLDYVVSDPNDEKQIEVILKKAIKKLGIAKNQVIIGCFEFFSGSKKLYDVDIFRVGNIQKNFISKPQ